jgi:hypothetical protein
MHHALAIFQTQIPPKMPCFQVKDGKFVSPRSILPWMLMRDGVITHHPDPEKTWKFKALQLCRRNEE